MSSGNSQRDRALPRWPTGNQGKNLPCRPCATLPVAEGIHASCNSVPRIELAGDAVGRMAVGQPVCIRANPLIRMRGERGNLGPPQKSK
jgi:hypothetical protein